MRFSQIKEAYGKIGQHHSGHPQKATYPTTAQDAKERQAAANLDTPPEQNIKLPAQKSDQEKQPDTEKTSDVSSGGENTTSDKKDQVSSTGSPTVGKGKTVPKVPTNEILSEAGILFELDYNKKDVIKQALKGPVTCGFEAELIFKNIQSFSNDDVIVGDQSMSDRLAYSDNEYEIRDLYKKFITDTDNDFGEAFHNYQMGKMSRDLEDEDWLDDYVNYSIDDDDIADYKQEALDTAKADDPDEYEERLEWDDAAWGRELAELKYSEEMQDYWMENLDDHKFERMLDRFEDNRQYGIAAWLESNRWDGTDLWDRAHELLGDPEEVNDEENPKQIAYREVEEWLDTWASKNSSQGSDIEVGDYHQTTGHDGWRIEEDGSLEGDGQGFEVISPVYETPADMLRDLDSLIKYANQQGDVETNRSTGLHITMSYDQESDVFPSIARTKMYVLSGSDWVAKAWGREFNYFTKQTTVQVLTALKGIATGNASEDNIKTMDDMIERFDDANLGAYGAVARGSSLNFKKEKNDKDNNLVEFRAAGNNYLPELGMIKKDVVRNSALIQATYDPDSHNKEFAKKMYKMLQQATEKEFDNPDPYDDTRGLSPDDIYRQNTGDRDTKVNDQELTQILMKYAHRDIQPATKKAISDFYRSLRTYNQFKNAPKDDEPQKPAQAPEPEKLDPLWEDAQEDELYNQKLKADIAKNLARLIVKLALSPNADKMPAKEVMAVRRLLKQHNLQLDSVLSELETVVRNDNIPDARDKQDISRIYRRASRLLGKDLTAQMPKGKNLVIPVNKVLLATHDSIREVMLGSDPQEEFIFMDKMDWQFALDVCDKINQAWDQWQQTSNDPNTTQQQEIDAEIQFKKQAHAGADLLWKRNKLDVDKVTGQADRLNKADYKPFKNGERLINAKDVLPQLEKAGVIVKDNNTQESAWESLMTKFEGKPLQEQLNLLGKLDKQKIDEAWNKAREHQHEMMREGAVPETGVPNEYQTIMSKPLLGGDLKAQLAAYKIIPAPEMIYTFRKQIAKSGKNCDLRSVFKSFANSKLHPTQKKAVGLAESVLMEKGLSLGDMGKRNNLTIFKQKISSSSPFAATDGAEVVITPSFARKIKTVDDLNQFAQGRQVMLPLKNEPGYVVPLSYLLKTAEFGGTAKKETGVANRGELAEGVLGAATFARIAKRPGKPITYNEVLKVIQSLPKTHTGGSISKNVKTGGVTDKIKLTVRLGANTYADLIDTQKLTSDALMNSYIKSTVQFVNDYTRLYATFFEQNGRPDEVEIVSDGVSENTDRKTDVYMIYVDEAGNRQLKHFDISLKAGTVKQFGQVGYGRGASPIETRFAKVMELFTQFGIDQNSFTFKPEQFQEDDGVALIKDLYKQAVELINQKLMGSDAKTEYNYLDQIAQGVTYYATSNDPTVKLLQLDKGRYYVLDFKKLRPKLDGIDLEAQYAETSSGDPIVRIHDKNNAKNSGRLLQIRTKQDSNGYIRQILEKEPLLKKLISVRHASDIER